MSEIDNMVVITFIIVTIFIITVIIFAIYKTLQMVRMLSKSKTKTATINGGFIRNNYLKSAREEIYKRNQERMQSVNYTKRTSKLEKETIKGNVYYCCNCGNIVLKEDNSCLNCHCKFTN